MKPVRKALGKHRPAFLLAALLLAALLAPAGPMGLRARLGFLYAPLALLAADGPAGDSLPGGEAGPARLLEEISALRAQVEGLRQENGNLREFHGLRFEARSLPARVLSANILAVDRLSPLRRSLLLDIGTGDGVVPGQAVVAGRSLLGLVAEAGAGWCQVRLLDDPGGKSDDPAARVAVQVLRPGLGKAVADGVVYAEVRGRQRHPQGPPRPQPPPDLVVTSAADPRVPAGLLVGVVRSVEDDRRTRLAEAEVEPSAGLGGLSSVLVLQLPDRDPRTAAGRARK